MMKNSSYKLKQLMSVLTAKTKAEILWPSVKRRIKKFVADFITNYLGPLGEGKSYEIIN